MPTFSTPRFSSMYFRANALSESVFTFSLRPAKSRKARKRSLSTPTTSSCCDSLLKPKCWTCRKPKGALIKSDFLFFVYEKHKRKINRQDYLIPMKHSDLRVCVWLIEKKVAGLHVVIKQRQRPHWLWTDAHTHTHSHVRRPTRHASATSKWRLCEVRLTARSRCLECVEDMPWRQTLKKVGKEGSIAWRTC